MTAASSGPNMATGCSHASVHSRRFDTYTRACETADAFLFRLGDPEAVDQACQRSPVGRLTSNALFVHKSAVAALEPALRIYEGCARAYLGEIDEANVVKLHRFSGKVSYLACPDFDTAPIPRSCGRSSYPCGVASWTAGTTPTTRPRWSWIRRNGWLTRIIRFATSSHVSPSWNSRTACWTV